MSAEADHQGHGHGHHHHKPTDPSRPSDLRLTLRHTRRSVTRCVAFGVAVRILFGILKALVKKRLSRQLIPAVVREVLSLDPLKWGAICAGFGAFRGMQKLVESATKSWVPPGREVLGHRLGTFAAGAVCSLPALVMNIETRTELALYLFVRSMHGVCTAHVIPNLPQTLHDFNYYDVVSMSLSAVQILYCFLFMPAAVQPGYLAFLQSNTGWSRMQLDAVASVHRHVLSPGMVAQCQKMNLPVPMPDMSLTCATVHTGTCNEFIVKYMMRHFAKFSMPLYLPLKIVTTCVFGWKACVKAPAKSAVKILEGSVRSSVFLTLYCTAALRTLCAFSQNGWHSPSIVAAVGGTLAGMSALVERKGRRLDLGLYCVMHAVRSCVLMLHRQGWLARPTRRWILLLHMFSVGTILLQYDMDRDKLHPHLLNGLAKALDEPVAHHHRHRGHHHKHPDTEATEVEAGSH